VTPPDGVPLGAVTIAVQFREPDPPGSRLAMRTVVEKLEEFELFTTKFRGLEELDA
jgi:hypothetical protein